MFSSLLLNIVTPFFVLYNCYGFYKDKKNRHFRNYFMILSLFLSFDLCFSFFTQYIPFIYFLKLAFVIWLSLPIFNGPSFIYNFYMKRIFVHFEGDIDAQFERTRKIFVETIVDKLNNAYGKYQEINNRLLPSHKEEQDFHELQEDVNKMIEEKVIETPNIDLPDIKQGYNRLQDENKDANLQSDSHDGFHASNTSDDKKIED